MAHYEAIVVGSGAGGLAAGLALTQKGHSVLVLEAATRPGGCLSPFQAEGYSFDVGVHYLGRLAHGDRFWRLLDELGLADRVAHIELDPQAIDRYVFPDFELRLCKGKERFKQQLIDLFPGEERGIDRFFEIYDRVNRASESFLEIDLSPGRLLRWMARNPVMLKYGRIPYQALLDAVTSDLRLQSALAAPWFDYMLPPERASVTYGVGTWYHYLAGGFYPRGGSGGLRDAFVGALEERGGTVTCSRKVERIDRRGNEFLVASTAGEEWTSRAVISNADPVSTLTELVNPELVPASVAEKARRLRPSASTFLLFVGTTLDLSALGMSSGNLVHYGAYDVNRIFRATMDPVAPDLATNFFVNSPSVRDPGAGLAPPGRQSLQILAGVSYSAFEGWASRSRDERGREYQDFVDHLGESLLSAVESYLPGLSGHLELVETLTPLDLEQRVQLVRGGIYGPELAVDQLGPRRFPDGTCGVEGLFLAGHGTKGGSVYYSVASGLQTGRRASSFLDASS